MMKLPVVLMNRVARGNGLNPITKLQPYLNMLPKAPPKPTNKKFLITAMVLQVS